MRTILIAIAALLGGICHAADFSEGEPRGGVPVILMKGQITDGDYARFERAVAGRSAAVLDMESPGGKVLEAVHIARRIRSAGFETSVRRGLCASACSMIWLAGSRRNFGPGARIGFHGPYLARTGPMGKREVKVDRFADGEFTVFLRWLGVDPALERFALSKGPDELNFLSRMDAVALGLKIHDGGREVGARMGLEAVADLPDPSCLATIGASVRDQLDESSLARCVVADIVRVRQGGFADPDARHRALEEAGVSADLRYVLLARYDSIAAAVIARSTGAAPPRR